MKLPVTSPFGPRVNPVTGLFKHHAGMDIALPQGTLLRPIAAGVVERVWVDDAVNGTALRVDHGGGWASSYVHLSALWVLPGERVSPDRPFGRSGGQPGTWGAGRSTGPHLHLALWRDGQAVDPARFIDWFPFTLQE